MDEARIYAYILSTVSPVKSFASRVYICKGCQGLEYDGVSRSNAIYCTPSTSLVSEMSQFKY